MPDCHGWYLSFEYDFNHFLNILLPVEFKSKKRILIPAKYQMLTVAFMCYFKNQWFNQSNPTTATIMKNKNYSTSCLGVGKTMTSSTICSNYNDSNWLLTKQNVLAKFERPNDDDVIRLRHFKDEYDYIISMVVYVNILKFSIGVEFSVANYTREVDPHWI